MSPRYKEGLLANQNSMFLLYHPDWQVFRYKTDIRNGEKVHLAEVCADGWHMVNIRVSQPMEMEVSQKAYIVNGKTGQSHQAIVHINLFTALTLCQTLYKALKI